MAQGKQSSITVEPPEVTVQINGPNGAGYVVQILNSNGVIVPGMTKSGNLDGNGKASVKFTLVAAGSYTCVTTFPGKANSVISEDFVVE